MACCAGIIGGNGSGKSTLFKMMMGQEQPDSGEVAMGQTVVPMYSEQSREGLSDDNTVRTVSAYNPHLMLLMGGMLGHEWLLQAFAGLPTAKKGIGPFRQRG